jgi:phage terminase small subunit
MALTDKQEMFCREYLTDLNATQAAIRAGYSAKTANRTAHENMTKPEIQARLAELMKERNQKAQISSEYVLNRLVEIDQLDVLDILNDEGDMKPVKEWPKSWRTTLSGLDIIAMGSDQDTTTLVKKIKWPDKLKNLELLGKHIDVQAFKEQTENRVTIQELSDEDIEQKIKGLISHG